MSTVSQWTRRRFVLHSSGVCPRAVRIVVPTALGSMSCSRRCIQELQMPMRGTIKNGDQAPRSQVLHFGRQEERIERYAHKQLLSPTHAHTYTHTHTHTHTHTITTKQRAGQCKRTCSAKRHTTRRDLKDSRSARLCNSFRRDTVSAALQVIPTRRHYPHSRS